MYETFKQLELQGKSIKLFDNAGAPEIILEVYKILPDGIVVKEQDNTIGFMAYHVIDYFQILDSKEFMPLTYRDKQGKLSLIKQP